MMRKVLGMATVTLSVKEYTDESNPQAYHIDIDQTVTGGIQGTREERVLDWQEREHVDTIFGKLRGKSRFLRGSKTDDGKVRPAVDFQTQVGDAESDARVKRFLRGEVLLDGSAAEGFVVDDEGAEFGEGEGLWMQSFVVNEESGWTAEQVRMRFFFSFSHLPSWEFFPLLINYHHDDDYLYIIPASTPDDCSQSMFLFFPPIPVFLSHVLACDNADALILHSVQIWGFEVINGERRYTRRVAVVKGKKVEMARLVYEYKGSNA